MGEPVLRFDPARRTNARAIADCVAMGYLASEQVIVDLTYGPAGGFWKEWSPTHLVTNDLFEEADHHHDYTALPGEWEGRFDVAVFDPPYKLNGTGGSHESDARFGVATPYRSLDDIVVDHIRGFDEAVRVTKPGGLVLYKTKDQVTCGRYTKLSSIMWEHARSRLVEVDGYPTPQPVHLIDELYVNAHIAQPKNRTKRCPACKGSGACDGIGRCSDPDCTCSDCPECGGSGRIPSVPEHFAANCSVLQLYRRPKVRR